MIRQMRAVVSACALVSTLALTTAPVSHAATTIGSSTFSITPLLDQWGNSEPAISIAPDGAMGISGLQWLNNPSGPNGTSVWTGPFGTTPTYRGIIDGALQKNGKTVFGGGDADVDMGVSGTLHATVLIFLANAGANQNQLGVAAITCPHATAPTFSLSACTAQILDTAGTDRPWITSEGAHVYISYHDSKNASLIRVQRSDDDGYTWQKVGSPIPSQGQLTADATFNNAIGKIVADPVTHNVYEVYAAGVPGYLKGHSFTPNHIVVARSIDYGKSWTAHVVYTGAVGVSLAYFFETLAVDPTNGKLYTAWSDGHTLRFSASADQASTWSAADAINTNTANPAPTAIFPWVAAYNGTVDVVFYGTSGTGWDDANASWYVYLAQTPDGATFIQSRVNPIPNHYGILCPNGDACQSGTRNLLDLFQVAINPQNGRAAIIYTDDTLTTTPVPNYSCLPGETTCPLPQVVLAQQQS